MFSINYYFDSVVYNEEKEKDLFSLVKTSGLIMDKMCIAIIKEIKLLIEKIRNNYPDHSSEMILKIKNILISNNYKHITNMDLRRLYSLSYLLNIYTITGNYRSGAISLFFPLPYVLINLIISYDQYFYQLIIDDYDYSPLSLSTIITHKEDNDVEEKEKEDNNEENEEEEDEGEENEGEEDEEEENDKGDEDPDEEEYFYEYCGMLSENRLLFNNEITRRLVVFNLDRGEAEIVSDPYFKDNDDDVYIRIQILDKNRILLSDEIGTICDDCESKFKTIIKIWNINNNKIETIFKSKHCSIPNIEHLFFDNKFVLNLKNRGLVVIDIVTGDVIEELNIVTEIYGFISDNEIIFLLENMLYVWDFNDTHYYNIIDSAKIISDIKFLKSGKILISYGNRISIWEYKKNITKLLLELPTNNDIRYFSTLSEDILLIQYENNSDIFNINTGKVLFSLGIFQEISYICDKVVVSNKYMIDFWDINTSTLEYRLENDFDLELSETKFGRLILSNSETVKILI